MPKRHERENPTFTVRIADCEVQDFTAGGKGGQHQNRSNTAIRVIHHPSGARGESREERSQLMNKRRAFRRMAETPAFRKWVAGTLVSARSATEWVDTAMDPNNLRIEYRRNGRWEVVE